MLEDAAIFLLGDGQFHAGAFRSLPLLRLQLDAPGQHRAHQQSDGYLAQLSHPVVV